jgi:hypothetical protein
MNDVRRVTLIAIGVLLQTALVLPAVAVAVDAEAVVRGKCTACHSVDVIRQTNRSKAEWQVLVDKEIERGAQLDEAERAAAVDWLAANYGQGAAEAAESAPAADEPTEPAATEQENETTATQLPFDEQAYTGLELWQFLAAGCLLLGGGAWLRRRENDGRSGARAL